MRASDLVILFGVAAGGLALVGGTAAQVPRVSLDVPFVPTPPEIAETMLKMANVNRGDTVYDLGSGDGRLVVLAAERYGARGVGIDLDPARVAEGRARAEKAGVVGRTQFIQGDLFEAELSPATVVTMYLLPEVNRRLQARLLEQLRPGARVVSHNYDLGDWHPDGRQVIGEHLVYLWVVPARVTGRWTWDLPLPSGTRQFTADIEQTFQNLKGSATGGDGEAISLRGKLDGDQIAFLVVQRRNHHSVTMRYRGQVAGGRATGTVTISDGAASMSVPWHATAISPGR